MSVHESPLGKKVLYLDQYQPDLLVAIDRSGHRKAWGGSMPFYGHDVWMGYELSWLDHRGKPHVALMQAVIPANSTSLIESKSFKLYLNSFNQSAFDGSDAVQDCLTHDLSRVAGAPVRVLLKHLDAGGAIVTWPGTLIDDLPICCDVYQPDASLLRIVEGEVGEQQWVSHLLKSNCLVTGQPDWGSVRIHAQGPMLDPSSLLQYIVSYRQHQGFHEDCVEQIFMDLYALADFDQLTVEAYYTRRGGLDIRPMRTTIQDAYDQPVWDRLSRQ